MVTAPPGFTSPPKCGYYFNGKYFLGYESTSTCATYSTDNGATWNSVTGLPDVKTKVLGFFNVSNDLFLYTSAKGVFKSTDGGLTWNAANNGLSNLKIMSVTIINSKIVLATDGGGVFISSDNGSNWVQSNSGITSSLNSNIVWTMGSNLYFYTIVGNQCFTSNNEGANWTSYNNKFPFLKSSTFGQVKSIKEVYRNGSNLYMMSTTQLSLSISDSVFISTNEGANWKNITDNLPNEILGGGLTEFNGNLFIAYGSANTGIYRRSTTLGTNESNLSNSVNVYPNPFNDKIMLSNATSQSIKQVFVYDELGKLVLSEIGNFEFVNTSNLNSGIYLFKIVFSDNSSLNRKLLK